MILEWGESMEKSGVLMFRPWGRALQSWYSDLWERSLLSCTVASGAWRLLCGGDPDLWGGSTDWLVLGSLWDLMVLVVWVLKKCKPGATGASRTPCCCLWGANPLLGWCWQEQEGKRNRSTRGGAPHFFLQIRSCPLVPSVGKAQQGFSW